MNVCISNIEVSKLNLVFLWLLCIIVIISVQPHMVIWSWSEQLADKNIIGRKKLQMLNQQCKSSIHLNSYKSQTNVKNNKNNLRETTAMEVCSDRNVYG